MMRMLKHPNIIQLNYFFYSSGTKKEEIYLNLVLEFVPETVYQVTRSFARRKEHVPALHVKVRGRPCLSPCISLFFCF
jgi:glycogen synthase kinase 3 beta